MTTKVAFVKDRTYGEIVAVFPDEKHCNYEGCLVMFDGGHTEGTMGWAIEQDEPTSTEIVDRFNELVSRGYNDLRLTSIF